MFVKAIEADLPELGDLLRNARIVVVGPLHLGRIGQENLRRVGGVGKLFDLGQREILHRRRHKITRIARVQRGVVGGFPDEVDARAQLPLMIERRVKAVVSRRP